MLDPNPSTGTTMTPPQPPPTSHEHVNLPTIGHGPRRFGYLREAGPKAPRCRRGDRVDVLLDDGRIVRTTIAGDGYFCGRVMIAGVGPDHQAGSMHIHRVRDCGAWSGEKGCSYLDGIFDA